jgi:uroporphyrinogen-III decarboxylase
MNIPFDIVKSKGPIIHKPIRTEADVLEVRDLVPDEAVPYVGETLRALRSEVSLVCLVASLEMLPSDAIAGFVTINKIILI